MERPTTWLTTVPGSPLAVSKGTVLSVAILHIRLSYELLFGRKNILVKKLENVVSAFTEKETEGLPPVPTPVHKRSRTAIQVPEYPFLALST